MNRDVYSIQELTVGPNPSLHSIIMVPGIYHRGDRCDHKKSFNVLIFEALWIWSKAVLKMHSWDNIIPSPYPQRRQSLLFLLLPCHHPCTLPPLNPFTPISFSPIKITCWPGLSEAVGYLPLPPTTRLISNVPYQNWTIFAGIVSLPNAPPPYPLQRFNDIPTPIPLPCK